MTKQIRVLPADVYDFLELSALEFGGIGAGYFGESYHSTRTDIAYGLAAPYCVLGHAAAAAPAGTPLTGIDQLETTQALRTAGIKTYINDDAVKAINARLGRDDEARVPFEEWARELGVVRGES